MFAAVELYETVCVNGEAKLSIEESLELLFGLVNAGLLDECELMVAADQVRVGQTILTIYHKN